MSRSDLIAALVATTEPDRELDARIWWLVERRKAETTYWNGAIGKPHPLSDLPPINGLGWFGVMRMAPAYTASLDAAKTVIRGDLLWFLGNSSDVWRNGSRVFRALVGTKERPLGEGESPIDAIALVIAALREREAEDG